MQNENVNEYKPDFNNLIIYIKFRFAIDSRIPWKALRTYSYYNIKYFMKLDLKKKKTNSTIESMLNVKI